MNLRNHTTNFKQNCPSEPRSESQETTKSSQSDFCLRWREQWDSWDIWLWDGIKICIPKVIFLRCADLAVNFKMVVPEFYSDVVLPTLKDWVGNCIHKRAVSMCTGRIVDYAAETMFPTMANETLHRGIWLCGHGTDVDKHRASKPEHKWTNNIWHDKKGKHAVWNRFTSVYLSCLSFFVQRKTVFLVVQVRPPRQRDESFLSQNYLQYPERIARQGMFTSVADSVAHLFMSHATTFA